jgi:hypothetical protein
MTISWLLIPLVVAGTLAADSVPFAGTWEGKLYGQPSVELVLRPDGGSVTGAITFYLAHRENEKAPWKIAGKTTLPLLEPKLDGGKLTFEVRHAKKHGSSEMGPNVRFRVELRGSNGLSLFRLDDGASTESMGDGMPLARRY